MAEVEWRERVKARARELGFNDAEVARLAGLATNRFSGYMVGRREPDLATFARICRILRTTPDVMLGFLEPGPEDAARKRAEVTLDRIGPSRLRLAAAILQAVATIPVDEPDAPGESQSKAVRPRTRRTPPKSG